MKKKERIRENYSPLLDGELSDEEREAIEADLAEEADLLRELDGLRRTEISVRSLVFRSSASAEMNSTSASEEFLLMPFPGRPLSSLRGLPERPILVRPPLKATRAGAIPIRELTGGRKPACALWRHCPENGQRRPDDRPGSARQEFTVW